MPRRQQHQQAADAHLFFMDQGQSLPLKTACVVRRSIGFPFGHFIAVCLGLLLAPPTISFQWMPTPRRSSCGLIPRSFGVRNKSLSPGTLRQSREEGDLPQQPAKTDNEDKNESSPPRCKREIESAKTKELGGNDPYEKFGGREVNVGDPQIKVQEKERSVTSILKELAAIQQQGPQKYCILGTRHCSYLHQQIIELLAYALVLSGNHVYTSGAGGTHAATIRGALRAERQDLLTVVLPQSMTKQKRSRKSC